MPTRPLWDLPLPTPPKPPESPEERSERCKAEGRARAAIRLRKTAEGNARLAVERKIESAARLTEEREWRKNHPPLKPSEVEILRGMFPNLKARKRP